MRRSRIWATLCLAACATAPDEAPQTIVRPLVVPVRALPAGTRLHTALAGDLPDDPESRAAAVWWREALRQSTIFEIAAGPITEHAMGLVLGIDPGGGRLAAFLQEPDGNQVALAGGVYAAGALTDGIDRIAWAARLALGEAADHPIPIALATSAVPRAV
ncbi:MAG: hypothetical protein KDC98_11795, partial [Planctomycetes bacterium]|nr:hypothetical protein [Planctomycetota bacterium]